VATILASIGAGKSRMNIALLAAGSVSVAREPSGDEDANVTSQLASFFKPHQTNNLHSIVPLLYARSGKVSLQSVQRKNDVITYPLFRLLNDDERTLFVEL